MPLKRGGRFTMMTARAARFLLELPVIWRMIEVIDRRSENRMTELGMIAHAMEFAKINGVEGDYFEFGLWQGKTFKYAHRMMLRYGLSGMKLRGFDSFQGLPDHVAAPGAIWQAGQYSYSQDALEKDLKSWGFKHSEYELVPGFFDESLNERLVERFMKENIRAALVYIDCDLYESTKPVLSFLTHFLQNGTIVCFDDYYNYKGALDQGEARALSELQQERPCIRFVPYMAYAPLGQSFIVRLC